MKLPSFNKKLIPVDFNKLLMFCGILATMTGLIYILNLPGLTSDATPTTVPWGWMAIFLGIITLWVGPGVRPARGFRKFFK